MSGSKLNAAASASISIGTQILELRDFAAIFNGYQTIVPDSHPLPHWSIRGVHSLSHANEIYELKQQGHHRKNCDQTAASDPKPMSQHHAKHLYPTQKLKSDSKSDHPISLLIMSPQSVFKKAISALLSSADKSIFGCNSSETPLRATTLSA